jgi:hypothetical protein
MSTRLKKRFVRRCEVCDETHLCRLEEDPWLRELFDKHELRWYCDQCWEALITPLRH